MLLDEVVFGAEGWPSINEGKGASSRAKGPAIAREQKDVAILREDFNNAADLPPGWQWPIGRKPAARVADGRLTLTTVDGPATAVQSITVPSFLVETAVETRTDTSAFAGIVVFGDAANHLALVTDGKKIQLWNQRRGERTTVAEMTGSSRDTIKLRVACIDGNRFRFAVQGADGAWAEFAGETDGSFLPPWDRGLRTGLYVAGDKGAAGAFDYFVSMSDDGKLLAR
jgi:hypothetical protein